MGRDRRLQGEALLKADDANSNPFLGLVAKLKTLRSRRKAHGTRRPPMSVPEPTCVAAIPGHRGYPAWCRLPLTFGLRFAQ